MDRIVNQEEAEARRNEIRRMLHDAGRRTMRLDNGAPARVHKMRRVRRMYRDWSTHGKSSKKISINTTLFTRLYKVKQGRMY